MKSKAEIIDETVEFYGEDPVKRRSKATDGSCLYQGAGGQRCAFSRCCAEDKLNVLKEGRSVRRMAGAGIPPDNVLDEEYKGHSVQFWVDLQDLHDSSWYWQLYGPKKGLSPAGELRVTQLKKKYCEDETTAGV